jgi:hypothetical protein
MVACLRQHFLYSEKRARDFLFGAAETALRHCGPLRVTRLAREAAILARQEAQTTHYEFANWETAGKAAINSMLAAGALLTLEGFPVRPGVGAEAAEVAALSDEFADITEAFLLEFLIRKLGDVTTRDHTALAHALFRQFDPNVPIDDMIERVVVLLARLADRVTVTEDGAYSVREVARAASQHG